MKYLLLSVALILSSLSMSAQIGNWRVQEANVITVGDKNWSNGHWGAPFEINVAYLFNAGQRFHIGAGLGVGMVTALRYGQASVKYYEENNLSFKENKFAIPVFAIAKFDILKKTSRPYVVLSAGKRICFVEDYHGNNFDPYVCNVYPAVGYDIDINGSKLGLELGYDLNFCKTQMYYSTKKISERASMISTNYGGLRLAVSYTF